MANTRSAEKQQRQAEKATVRNRAGKSRLKSTLKKTRASVAEGNADAGKGNEGHWREAEDRRPKSEVGSRKLPT